MFLEHWFFFQWGYMNAIYTFELYLILITQFQVQFS